DDGFGNFGVVFGTDINTGLCAFVPNISFDSWVTIGGDNTFDATMSVNSVWTNPADPLIGLAGPEPAESIYGIDGAWFTVNGNSAGIPTGPDNRVLLGQFTTDGAFGYKINLNIFDGGDDISGNLQYVASSDLDCGSLSGQMIDGSALGLIGGAAPCGDLTACNYFEGANPEDTDLCCYGICGCDDPLAVNYNAQTDCSTNQSCEYSYEVNVFNDLNNNEIWDNDELGIPNHPIELSNESTGFTNSEGRYFFTWTGGGSVTVSTEGSEIFPFLVGSDSEVLQGGSPEITSFALSADFPISDIEITAFGVSNTTYPCNDTFSIFLIMDATGNVDLDSMMIDLSLDPANNGIESLTNLSSFGSITVESLEGNNATVISNDIGYSYSFIQLEFNAPTEQFIGEIISNSFHVIGYSNGVIAAEDSLELEHEVTCAYDPNDKQVFPNGFSDDHYILPETELEYLVRFQNTGNAPATNITIRDTISEYLDLSTFQLASNTHEVEITLDSESREVQFFFPNIMLPDSTCCFDESIGMFSYRIEPFADLPFETRIENTAYIFFDNNPP
ncbi:MAG: hypothetical protein AAF193_06995, partial [Bacteroidota bacterium]